MSSCLGHRKKSAWLAWRSCPSVIDAFLDLHVSLQPVNVSSETLEGIERFLVVMHSRTCSAGGVRKELFAHGSRTMEPNKPTKVALLQHVRRAAYQAGYVWSQALVPVPVLPSPALWGWLTSHSGWKPFWTELRRPLHATNVHTADARRTAVASANDEHHIYSAQNSANVEDHVATTCSSPFLVHSSSHSVSLSLSLVCLYMTHIITRLLCRLY